MQQEMRLEKRPLASHNRINPTKRAISGDPIVFPVIKDALPSFLSTSSGNSPRGTSPHVGGVLALGLAGSGAVSLFTMGWLGCPAGVPAAVNWLRRPDEFCGVSFAY